MTDLSTTSRPLVKNGEDREQLAAADAKLLGRRAEELLDIRNIVSSESGRRFMFRVLAHLHVFEDVWDLDPGLMGFRAARQKGGLWLLKELEAVDPSVSDRMRTEARNRAMAPAQKAPQPKAPNDKELTDG